MRSPESSKHGISRDSHVSQPDPYMALHSTSAEEQPRMPADYEALQAKNSTSDYYNVRFNKGNVEHEQQEENVYEIAVERIEEKEKYFYEIANP